MNPLLTLHPSNPADTNTMSGENALKAGSSRDTICLRKDDLPVKSQSFVEFTSLQSHIGVIGKLMILCSMLSHIPDPG